MGDSGYARVVAGDDAHAVLVELANGRAVGVIPADDFGKVGGARRVDVDARLRDRVGQPRVEDAAPGGGDERGVGDVVHPRRDGAFDALGPVRVGGGPLAEPVRLGEQDGQLVL